MTTTHRHVYLKKKGRGGNEYRVISAPAHMIDEIPKGYQRIPRREALKEARWTWDHGPAYVTVTPCACGECALAQYAETNENSALAERVRRGKRDLRNGQPDILGRQQHNPYTGEYDGDLPPRNAVTREADA